MLCKLLTAMSNMLPVFSSKARKRIEAIGESLTWKPRTEYRHKPRKRVRIYMGNGLRHSLILIIEGALFFGVAGRKYCTFCCFFGAESIPTVKFRGDLLELWH